MAKRLHTAPKTTTADYPTLEDIWLQAIEAFKPPERMSIAEAAEKFVYLNNPGQGVGFWSRRLTPYMVEPQECLKDRMLNSTVFVGSAQSGKTQGLILNWLAYCARVDGMDMLIFSPTQSGARDFSIRRVDRMHRDSRQIGRLVTVDNVFDIQYRSGCLLGLAWPTVAQLAGRPVGRIALTDYDRMDDSIGDEGSPFDLAQNRTRTFGSYAMTVAESSPSRDIEDGRWVRTSEHEAPPCKGIFSLYNRGDRRRWYWPCPHCGEFFIGQWEHLQWDAKKTALESGETVRMICPNHGCVISPDSRQEMNQDGVWLRDGQTIDPATHAIKGEGARSRTASFWLDGVASAFMPWSDLVSKFILASEDLERTGSEDALRAVYNTDMARAYMPLAMKSELSPVELHDRSEPFPTKDMPEDELIDRNPQKEPLVPRGVRFLIATIDVQNSMFPVQVHGIVPGSVKGMYDIIVLDRFQIRYSRRMTRLDEHEWVKPFAYLDDWDEIRSQVMDRTYEVDDGTGRRMSIKLVGCDSGGGEGGTTNAYNFQRRMRAEGRAFQFQLIQGRGTPGAPRAHIAYPDVRGKDKFTKYRSDIPLLQLNSNIMKDTAFGRLNVTEEGQGRIRFPNWFHMSFFNELCVESRTDKGWVNAKRLRNEAWDMLYYCLGLLVSNLIKVETINWDEAPAWAAPWDSNSLVTTVETVSRFRPEAVDMADFRDFGKMLAGRT